MSQIARTQPPAKLNLFLELIRRRPDGFHDIDTVMVPIDWQDELSVQRRAQPGVELHVQWLPSREVIANQLGLSPDSEQANQLLSVPTDHTNLVCRAVEQFCRTFEIDDGFLCKLGKRIPAGAGMGGASSDAAAALRCCAKLCGIPLNHPQLWETAADIGSDVPFFLGIREEDEVQSVAAMRATGRGEVLSPAEVSSELHFVVAYPAVALSTAKVYADCQVPPEPTSADKFLAALARDELAEIGPMMMNRLTDPAKKNASEIDKMLRSLWRSDLRVCQLTGSGSACFGVADTLGEAQRCANRVSAMLEPGAIVKTTRGIRVPATVELCG